MTPRDLNLVRCYLGIGQPDEQGMTFQELAVWLNYNGPSGAEKVYKSAIRKLKRHLHGGDYGAWLDIQRTLREAQREAGREAEYGSPQAHMAGGTGTDPGLSMQDGGAEPRVPGPARGGQGWAERMKNDREGSEIRSLPVCYVCIAARTFMLRAAARGR